MYQTDRPACSSGNLHGGSPHLETAWCTNQISPAATSDSLLKSTSTLRTPSTEHAVLDRFQTSHPALNIFAAVALPIPFDAPVMTAVPDIAGALVKRTPALRRLVANCPGDPDTVTLTSTHP
mmetsp:Transcript_31979/g.76680  ORF Transcript_31979/g.76680 Transcript_31979/m.76680 type:complete len:122 (-) Transcript_31979:1125-1490(-)